MSKKQKLKNENSNISTKNPYKPKISVILPTFNGAKTIKRAINSVLNQSFKYFELIIVDDASTDNTPEIVNSYNDKRIIYLKRDINSHKTKENARNDGLRIAKGKYIAYIDSDNRWLKDYLKILFEYLERNNDIGMVYCDSWIWRDNKKMIERYGDFDKNLFETFGFIDTGEVMHRKSCIEKAGLWDLATAQQGDEWYFFRKISKYYEIKHLKKTLCNYYCKNTLVNTQYIFKKGKQLIIDNKKITPKSIKLLKRTIESSRTCLLKSSDMEEIKVIKKIIATANAIMVFKNKKEILDILRIKRTKDKKENNKETELMTDCY